MTEIIFISIIGIFVIAVAMAVRRAKRRRRYNPDDIYPLW